MDKHIWKKVQISSKSETEPAPRWGHNCCTIGDQIVFFGGYADSTYMNDIWAYNTSTMQWKQVKTTGDIPSNRSNISMNYDSQNNRIIIFGGGGPNKKRFNTISILDWSTKDWLQIYPKQNQPAPWERTYHCAQLMYPYLIVFGGEGIVDMDDLWLFNFLTLSWAEVNFDINKPKPYARRFHSSVLVDNQFFIIAGCHSKYRPLNDIFSLDLTPLKEGRIQDLQWKQRKFKGSAFLTRWGQSSTVYDNKIYIFGGRFSSDLNDILIVDLEKQTMKTLKTNIQAPKPRRRHCSCFIGSNMIVFGGFNGQYFNDLYYINVFELKSKLCIPPIAKNPLKFLNKSTLADEQIFSTTDKIMVHKGLLVKSFLNEQCMNSFLKQINQKYETDELLEILKCLYLRFGKIDAYLIEKYHIKLYTNENQKQNQIKKQLMALTDTSQNKRICQNYVLTLDDYEFSQFLDRQRDNMYCDTKLVINKNYQLPINKVDIGLASLYFQNLFSSKFADLNNGKISLPMPSNNVIIFQILLNYLTYDHVIVPQEMNFKQWMALCEIAQNYCLGRLLLICQNQLCYKITEDNYNQVMIFALTLQLDILALWCAEYEIRLMLKQQAYLQQIQSQPKTKKQYIIKAVYDMMKFDILQTEIGKEKSLSIKKKESSSHEEKENYEVNCNE